MLFAELSKNHGAIGIWGTTYDLGALHDLIHRTTSDDAPFTIEVGDWIIGFAYEIRKAREDQRLSDNIKDFHDNDIPYYGCEILLPYWCMYLGAVRSAAKFITITADEQSLLWKLEALTRGALSKHLSADDLENLIQYSYCFDARHLKNVIEPSCWATAYFINFSKKKRLQELVGIIKDLNPTLWMIDALNPECKWPTSKDEVEAIWDKAKI
ncbi:MAG: hypothetical protein COA43_14135 [Robiginitomaculum sp.]|nr:MAG: hypothetical protein COA43_14135 [Robiginitomaculum sp.]